MSYFGRVDIDSDYPEIAELGLRREQSRFGLFVDYDVNEYTISSVTSFDDELVNSIRDLDATGVLNWINFDQFRNRSFFQEFRLTSPGDRRFTWLLGASYYNGENFGYYLNGGESVVAEDGGMTAPDSFTLDDFFGRTPAGVCPCGFDGFNAPPVQENETLGIFGSDWYSISATICTLILKGAFKTMSLRNGIREGRSYPPPQCRLRPARVPSSGRNLIPSCHV